MLVPRRDRGLEFLDVTAQTDLNVSTTDSTDTWVITNVGDSVIDTHLLVLSARSEPALRAQAARYAGRLARGGDALSDVCFSASS